MRFLKLRNAVNTESGTGIEYEFGYVIDERTGVKSLEIIGETNVQESIDSHKEYCDIHNILKRYAEGDIEALNKTQGFYIDATELPTNYAELFSRVNEAQSFFDKLPANVKAEFNNSASEFWASIPFGTEVQASGSDVVVDESVVNVKVVDTDVDGGAIDE